MNELAQNEFESRRFFLRKTAYIAPVLVMLGSLNAQACETGHNHGSDKTASSLQPHNNCKSCDHKGNNGWGNGDQNAPGNSLTHNNAENSMYDNNKKKVNNAGIDTHGGSEKDLADNKKGNNGWGNGDQNAPGNSLMNNNAENNHAGLNNPSHGKYSNS